MYIHSLDCNSMARILALPLGVIYWPRLVSRYQTHDALVGLIRFLDSKAYRVKTLQPQVCCHLQFIKYNALHCARAFKNIS